MPTKLEQAKLALLCMQRHSWEQGTAMQAFYELGDMPVVIAMAKEAAYRRLPDGRAAMVGGSNAVTDPCSVGEAMKAALEATGDAELEAGLEALKKWALELAPRNAAGVLYHIDDRPEFWVDSMYMLPPFLMAIGETDAALRNVDGYWAALYDESAGLMSHMWDDAKAEYPRKAHWGTGIGWTLAAFARMIPMMPKGYEGKREELVRRAVGLIEATLRWETKEHLFHDVVDDPETFLETNLAQMLAYALYRGVRDGWLEARYRSAADRLHDAAEAKMDAYGRVQDVCGAPSFDKPGVSPEGQAFYLLMKAARGERG